MKQRILTALLIIAVVAIPLFFGGIPLEILAVFVVGAAAVEWINADPHAKEWPFFLIPVLVLAVLIQRFVDIKYLFAFYTLIIIFLWTLTIFQEKFDVVDGFYCLAYFFIFSMVYRTMGWLVAENHLYLLVIVIATYLSDTGAWFFGRKFGKNKMNPRLSPKKSWEGFFGGWITGTVITLCISLLAFSFLSTPLCILLSLLCPVVAEVGDLSFSAIKRHFDIKDFSNLLPGHGGVLDRVDSLIMNILLLAILYPFFF